MSTKISQLTSATDVTANDLIQIVDVEDGVMAPSGTNKKATASLLANQLVPLIDAGAIAGSKIADSGITSAKIADGTIVNADINASASIAGTKVSPNFGSQNIVTTGSFSAGTESVISGSSSGDALRITQTGTGNSIVVEDSANPDSTPFIVRADGSIVKGFNASPASIRSTNAAANVNDASGFFNTSDAVSGSSFSLLLHSNSIAAAMPSFTVGRSRGSSPSIRGSVNNGDVLGALDFIGDDGLNLVGAANISTLVDGAPSSSSMPGRIVFSTSPSGSTIPVEALRITSGQGVQIARTSVTSPVAADGNVFSGTYTPTLANVTNLDASTAYSCQYMRVGNVVTVSGRLEMDPTSSAANTELRMSIPIASNFSLTQHCGGTFSSAITTGSNVGAIFADTNNDAVFRFYSNTSTNSSFFFTFTYKII